MRLGGGSIKTQNEHFFAFGYPAVWRGISIPREISVEFSEPKQEKMIFKRLSS